MCFVNANRCCMGTSIRHPVGERISPAVPESRSSVSSGQIASCYSATVDTKVDKKTGKAWQDRELFPGPAPLLETLPVTTTDLTSIPLLIRLFGPFTVSVKGLPLARLRARKGEALLALLILRHGQTVQRSWLAATLWPDGDPSQGLTTLRRYLTDLRQA